ncbi:hypothetical protein SDC9_168135 [bioreactor metagenome]|uniref:4Fe-4S domain-containing protein n=1 Tax=bioreactor metagenome TaxID=1076179 RepID=A0A645G3P4_9ZZZZ
MGGVLTVENPYIAQARLQTLRRYLPVSLNQVYTSPGKNEGYIPDGFFLKHGLTYQPVSQLDSDRGEAMKKMAALEKILQELPMIDCGSCGSPSCRAFAEDIVKGEVSADECVVKMRAKLKNQIDKNDIKNN